MSWLARHWLTCMRNAGKFSSPGKHLEKMQAEGFKPDEFTFVSVLSACAQSGLLDLGKDMHTMLGHRSIKLCQIVLNALVDMYTICATTWFGALCLGLAGFIWIWR
ncbi:hypothetical protein ACFX13_002502 [Malus domestica]